MQSTTVREVDETMKRLLRVKEEIIEKGSIPTIKGDND
jgi:hypothetical protein